jgi:hypothetical protein
LLQLAQEALDIRKPAHVVWRKGERFVDGLRPALEPIGFKTPEAVALHRQNHLFKVRAMLHRMNLMIFTLGLTEAWVDGVDGTVYPTAADTVASPPPQSHLGFKNFTTAETIADFVEFRDLVKRINPTCAFLLTVSPVPLTATAGVEHVLAATTYSKSALRAAAGELAGTYPDVDYFPSYEIISSPAYKGFFFEPNLRSVSAAGVEHVMQTFFAAHPPHAQKPEVAPVTTTSAPVADVACEEALLEAFAK